MEEINESVHEKIISIGDSIIEILKTREDIQIDLSYEGIEQLANFVLHYVIDEYFAFFQIKDLQESILELNYEKKLPNSVYDCRILHLVFTYCFVNIFKDENVIVLPYLVMENYRRILSTDHTYCICHTPIGKYKVNYMNSYKFSNHLKASIVAIGPAEERLLKGNLDRGDVMVASTSINHNNVVDYIREYIKAISLPDKFFIQLDPV